MTETCSHDNTGTRHGGDKKIERWKVTDKNRLRIRNPFDRVSVPHVITYCTDCYETLSIDPKLNY